MISTKQCIHTSALELFIKYGYDNVTVEDICNKCNITKSTFYYHMTSKQDIIVYHYDQLVTNLEPLLISLLSVNDSWTQLVMLFEFLIENITKYGVDFNKQAAIISIKDSLRTFELRQEIKDLGTNIIKNGQHKNEFNNNKEAHELFEAAAFLFFGYEMIWTLGDGSYDWKTEFTHSLSLLINK